MSMLVRANHVREKPSMNVQQKGFARRSSVSAEGLSALANRGSLKASSRLS